MLPIVRESGLSIVLEPGRNIVGPAGALVTRVVDVKEQPGGKLFVILDAGMTELIRPMLYNAYHRIEPVETRRRRRSALRCRRPAVREQRHARQGPALAAPEVGDLFAVLDAGAYGSVMASNYNRRSLPAEVMVETAAPDRHSPPPDDRRHAGARDLMMPRYCLIAFEGLDQSGKQTQAERCATTSRRVGGVPAAVVPRLQTHIGAEIFEALHGERDYAPDVMQLLYVANRYEKRPQIERWLADGVVVICDRYLASSIAYGEAQGLDAAG